MAVQVTFADQLGAAKHSEGEGEVSSKNEAKKLAFYLFWNIKPYFDRCLRCLMLACRAFALQLSSCGRADKSRQASSTDVRTDRDQAGWTWHCQDQASKPHEVTD